MIRRPPRSTLFPYNDALPISSITIPGYMVWVAVGYAGIGSGLTWLVGRPLIRLNTERYAREADLRFALVRVNESAESVALYNGEPDERRSLDEFVEAVLKASRRLSGGLARLTWITSGYGWLAIVVPILAAAPDYFAGRLSFGGMMMVVGAFNQVQDRKSTRLNSSHANISYAVFCLKKKKHTRK